MTIDIEDTLNTMLTEGAKAFGGDWPKIKNFASVEFRKIAVQLADIAENVADFELDPAQGYSPQTGKLLLEMQRKSTEAVLVALTAMTLLAVRKALDAVLKVVKTAAGVVLSAVL